VADALGDEALGSSDTWAGASYDHCRPRSRYLLMNTANGVEIL
jgi:hypothetical protein